MRNVSGTARPAVWALVGWYEAERSRALLDRESEGALVGLLGRLAFVTPHEGAWERNWLALGSQARRAAVARITPQGEDDHDPASSADLVSPAAQTV